MNEAKDDLSEEDDQETVMDIANKTWKVMHVNLRKEGYREGASSGKESVMQSSFDSGYNEGFKVSYVKGVLLGVLSVLECEKQADEKDVAKLKDDLQDDFKCIMCSTVGSEISSASVKSTLEYIQKLSTADVNSLIVNSRPLLRSLNMEPDVIFEKKFTQK